MVGMFILEGVLWLSVVSLLVAIPGLMTVLRICTQILSPPYIYIYIYIYIYNDTNMLRHIQGFYFLLLLATITAWVFGFDIKRNIIICLTVYSALLIIINYVCGLIGTIYNKSQLLVWLGVADVYSPGKTYWSLQGLSAACQLVCFVSSNILTQSTPRVIISPMRMMTPDIVATTTANTLLRQQAVKLRSESVDSIEEVGEEEHKDYVEYVTPPKSGNKKCSTTF